jgi:hypothetical protein
MYKNLESYYRQKKDLILYNRESRSYLPLYLFVSTRTAIRTISLFDNSILIVRATYTALMWIVLSISNRFFYNNKMQLNTPIKSNAINALDVQFHLASKRVLDQFKTTVIKKLQLSDDSSNCNLRRINSRGWFLR